MDFGWLPWDSFWEFWLRLVNKRLYTFARQHFSSRPLVWLNWSSALYLYGESPHFIKWIKTWIKLNFIPIKISRAWRHKLWVGPDTGLTPGLFTLRGPGQGAGGQHADQWSSNLIVSYSDHWKTIKIDTKERKQWSNHRCMVFVYSFYYARG